MAKFIDVEDMSKVTGADGSPLITNAVLESQHVTRRYVIMDNPFEGEATVKIEKKDGDTLITVTPASAPASST
jgi:hypothetical protein